MNRPTTTKDILRGVFVLPICAGHLVQRRNNAWRFDGSVSALVLLLLVISLTVAITSTNGITKYDIQRLTGTLILMTLMVLCAIGEIIRVVLKNRREQHNITITAPCAYMNMETFFLWIFAILASLFCTFHFLVALECLQPGISDVLDVFRISKLSFSAVLVLFIFTEASFITYFSVKKLQRSVFTWRSVVVLVCVNVVLWVNTFILQGTALAITHSHVENNTFIRTCINNSSVSRAFDDSSGILNPGFIEFLMLAVTLIISISNSPTDEQGHEEISNDSRNFYIEEAMTDITSLLVHDHETETISGDVTSDRQESVLQMSRNHYGTIIVCVIIILPNIIGYMVDVIIDLQYSQVRVAMNYWELGQKLLMVVGHLTGFVILQRDFQPPRRHVPLTIREGVYLLAAVGMFVTHFFEIIIGVVANDKTGMSTTLQNTASILQDYLQVVFLIYANRNTAKHGYRRRFLIEAICIVIMSINLGFWFTDNFLISNYDSTRETEQHVLGNTGWYIFNNILMPVNVYYRFSSGWMYYYLFRKLSHYRNGEQVQRQRSAPWRYR